MAYTIIDRRKNTKGKSTDNRQRFVRRVREQVRKSVKDSIIDGSVESIVGKKGTKISIPGKGLDQPTFHHNRTGGDTDRVYPGNKEFQQGDRHQRPPEGDGGAGSEGSPDGEGDDEFTFELTQEEFLNIFFEDLELPDLVKKSITKTEEVEQRRAGFSVDGNPSRMNIVRSMKQSKGRRLGLRAPKKKKIKRLEAELATIREEFDAQDQDQQSEIARITAELETIKRKLKNIPFIDDVDLRYNRWDSVPIPTTQAVMFGIMDVSASMGEWEKEMAKRFFMLLLLFLSRNYERVDIVWIRHHTAASEVDEDEFFHSRDTGGTIVSTALELMNTIIDDRYPTSQWNVFGSQVSDGDNWSTDNYNVQQVMQDGILPKTQFFSYVEVINRVRARKSELHQVYENIAGTHPNLTTSIISDITEIYPIFRELFEKK